MVDSAGSDDGDDAGDAELPPPPRPGQQPVGAPNDADERGRGVAKGILVLAALVFVVPLLAIGGLVLLFAGSGDDFVDEGFAEDPDQRVLSSLDDGIETGFAQRIDSGIPNVFDVVVRTERPTTVVALNPNPSEPSRRGRSTQLIVGGDPLGLPQGEQYTLSTTEDCEFDCTIEFTVVDPVNFHILGSNDVEFFDLTTVASTRWERVIGVDSERLFQRGDVTACVNGIDVAEGVTDHFIAVYPAFILDDAVIASQQVETDPSARCQAEFTFPVEGWVFGEQDDGQVPFIFTYFGNDDFGDLDRTTIELS